MTPGLVLTALAAVVQQPSPVPASVRDTIVCATPSDSAPIAGPCALERGTLLLQAASAQIAAHNLDSAATLLRRVAEAPAHTAADRVKAWVLLGVVGFYTTGDSAAASAFRQALALDPGLQAAFDQFDPALTHILAAERAALTSPAQPPPPAAAPAVYDCVGKCPEGVRPPQFTFFPQLQIMDASVSVYDTRMRTYLTFRAVISADGILEPETLEVSGGTARRTEEEIRRGLAQARFAPGRADGIPVRTRVTLRFDFEAEGSSWIKYTYRVMARR